MAHQLAAEKAVCITWTSQERANTFGAVCSRCACHLCQPMEPLPFATVGTPAALALRSCRCFAAVIAVDSPPELGVPEAARQAPHGSTHAAHAAAVNLVSGSASDAESGDGCDDSGRTAVAAATFSDCDRDGRGGGIARGAAAASAASAASAAGAGASSTGGGSPRAARHRATAGGGEGAAGGGGGVQIAAGDDGESEGGGGSDTDSANSSCSGIDSVPTSDSSDGNGGGGGRNDATVALFRAPNKAQAQEPAAAAPGRSSGAAGAAGARARRYRAFLTTALGGAAAEAFGQGVAEEGPAAEEGSAMPCPFVSAALYGLEQVRAAQVHAQTLHRESRQIMAMHMTDRYRDPCALNGSERQLLQVQQHRHAVFSAGGGEDEHCGQRIPVQHQYDGQILPIEHTSRWY